MKIPYGQSNFADIRREGLFYADKTGFIPLLESSETGSRYLLFLRPRRFGKSLLISMLEHYYDVAQAPAFDELFSGLVIHGGPTPLRNQYLVLRLDFSTVDVHSGPDLLRATFFASVRAKVRAFLDRYQELVPAYSAMLARLESYGDPVSLMLDLFASTPARRRIYLLVDEYDNFANELIAQQKTDLYHEIIGGAGLVRTFYKTLKEAAGTGVVARILLSGVSPVTLDDLSSGFNIVSQISLVPAFNAMAGFTTADVERAVAQFVALTPQYGSPETLLAELLRSYNGYSFAEDARERMCNPDMVLYFLMQTRQQGRFPKDLLDVNVRTDYSKLRQLATPPGGRQDWHEELMQTLLTEGRVLSPLIDRFGARKLYERYHLVSLLYFMGLLTIGGAEKGQLRLEVPNQAIRTLHWEGLIQLLRERAGILVDTTLLQAAVSRMAYDGEIEPFLLLIQEQVMAVLSNRDLIHFDEKHIKMVLLTYLSLSPIYRPLSEKEFAQGYGDLLLALDRRFPDAKYAYLLELKHLKTGAGEEQIEAALTAAAAQIERYLEDGSLLPSLLGRRAIPGVALVYVGARAYRCRSVRTVHGGDGPP